MMANCESCWKCYSGKCKSCPQHKAELEEFKRRTEGWVHELAIEIWHPRTKPVEVADGVESNSASILGGSIFLQTPTPLTRPNMTGTGSIFDDTTYPFLVPVDTFHSKLAGGLCKSHHHNMPATIQWQIQAFPQALRGFSPVSPPIHYSWDKAESHVQVNDKVCANAFLPKLGEIPNHPSLQSLSIEQAKSTSNIADLQPAGKQEASNMDATHPKLGTRGISQSSAWRKAEYGTNICVFQERDIMYSFRAQPCRFHEFPGMYSLSTNDSRVRHSLNDE